MPRHLPFISFQVFLFFTCIANGQDKLIVHSNDFLIPNSGTVNPAKIKADYFPSLLRLEMPEPGMGIDEEKLDSIKESLGRHHNKQDEIQETDSLAAPGVHRTFIDSIYYPGVPNDNDVAISDSGIIISVKNSVIGFFDTSGRHLSAPLSLDAFSDTLKLKQDKYDPRVLYDPDAKRFILCCLNGFNDSTSFVVLAFSKTADPLGEWNIYKVPGNPVKDTTWSDFPIVALSKDELFLTLNSIGNNKTWQAGFRQSYIWQINKSDGYSGATLRTKLHTGILYKGKPFRNLCPIQGGASLKPLPMYVLSNRNFDVTNDSIFLLSVRSLQSMPAEISLTVLKAPVTYGVAPNGHQPNDKSHVNTLETNDARVLDGFFENNSIQFVGNSSVSGHSGVFHGLISNLNNPSISLTQVKISPLDFGYPAIAYAGRTSFEDDAIIVVNHSSDTTFPGNSLIYYRKGIYSTFRLKNGSNNVDLLPGKERWGDYSGAQPRYIHPGEVWLSSGYGYRRGSGPSVKYIYGTSISSVTNQSPVDSGATAVYKGQADQTVVFPSPLPRFSLINVHFNLDEEKVVNFEIYDAQGKLITTLLNVAAGKGENIFSFTPAPLRAGVYFLRGSSGGRTLFTKKFAAAP